ncbi:MAG: aminomethyl-transferring glycine dehydrogenase subunit GcvPA [Legionella sp.]|uniref:aminomethyl-transferring glycine dehydrogenase subunit GcvPA n=1 Tax=Legionella sp. TaxID=459 RepID=UPI0039E61D2A
MPYIPHTPKDTKNMLDAIGVAEIQSLFDEIPASLHYAGFQEIPAGINEMELLKEAQKLGNQNRNGICFLGAGSYEHHIPAAVWDITSRGEFLTAYTPYQAEASQGTLQLLYEYQTMICELTGMDVANASMYDGATALAEAALMAVRVNKHSKTNRILITGATHPLYLETIKTILSNQHIEVITLPFNEQQGITDLSTLAHYNGEDITALIITQPNFFGCLEPVDQLSNWAHENQVISVACVNPTSLALLKPPGIWGEHGVDIVCGEGQPLGAPMASGGPYFGFLSTRMTHVRQMPGRIIGCTLDKEGKRGFTLTLQAREQHIRRAKATSNICTNQGLLVTAATIYMSLLGAEGLYQVASQCHQNTHELVAQLTQIKGVELVFSAPYFHEALLKLPRPVDEVLKQLADAGITGGLAAATYYPQLQNTLLVCATEMRTAEDIALYTKTLKLIMS